LTSKSLLKVEKLRKDIDEIFSGKNIGLLLNSISRTTDLSEDVIASYLKQRFGAQYFFPEKTFKGVSLFRLPLSIIRFFGFLSVCLYKSKKNESDDRLHVDLLIDNVQTERELLRYSKISKYFKSENVACVSRVEIPKVNPVTNNLIKQETLRGYDRVTVLRYIIIRLIPDFLALLFCSIKLKVDIVNLYTYLLNDYFYYKTVFDKCIGKYIIHDRNLGNTNSVKNSLFKSAGGKVSACIQKNIIKYDELALYYDEDILFTMGKKTGEGVTRLGGRVDQKIAVGSFAMERVVRDVFLDKGRKTIDVLYIGINAITSKRSDWTGYYESIKWLAKLSNAKKNYNIIIKHHPSWVPDKKEDDLISGTSIKYADKNSDSYNMISDANTILTYGSTMGYELIGLGKNAYFLEPFDNNPFLNEFVYSGKHIIFNFNELLKITSESVSDANADSADFCVDNVDVSLSIYENLTSTRV